MTTTPTTWKAEFYPNFAAPAGRQTVPQTIGLANGNILVVWEDDTQGASPGIDVMGRIFTPEGHPAAAPFQVNTAVVASDETGPKIVALPDGGFVVAYGSWFEAVGGFIEIERFNSNGVSVFSDSILSPNSSLTNWELASDDAGNYTIIFEERMDRLVFSTDPLSKNLYGYAYDHATNARGPLTEMAQNSRDGDDTLAAVDTFASGRVITLYSEPDDSGFPLFFKTDSIEFRISNPLTGTTSQAVEIAEGEGFLDDLLTQDVAVLSGGKFVMLYDRHDFNHDDDGSGLFMKIGAGEAPGSAIGPEIALHEDVGISNAQVVALNDGGFFVAWVPLSFEPDVHLHLYGQRFTANGDPIGDRMDLATDVTLSEVSLTDDGRILVPYVRNGEIAQVILDPRENVIRGTDAGEAITTQLGDTILFGDGGDDTLLGQNGNDELHGDLGADVLRGRTGDDIYVLTDVNQISFFPIRFAFDQVVEGPGPGTDTVMVQRPGQTRMATSYILPAHVENGIVTGTDIFNLYGNEFFNRLTGNRASNTLASGLGDDVLDGRLGADTLQGGDHNDTYILRDLNRIDPSLPKFAYDDVIENAGEGVDTVRVERVGIVGSYTLGANIENGVVTGTDRFGLAGNALDNRLTGNGAANALAGGGGDDFLNGLAGNDALLGSFGNDVMNGGAGLDAFIFNTAPNETSNFDIVQGFGHADDTIRLSKGVFATLSGAPGSVLAAGEFALTGAAPQADDRIIYDPRNGNLFYDADGGLRGNAVAFARITNPATAGLAFDDFLIA